MRIKLVVVFVVVQMAFMCDMLMSEFCPADGQFLPTADVSVDHFIYCLCHVAQLSVSAITHSRRDLISSGVLDALRSITTNLRSLLKHERTFQFSQPLIALTFELIKADFEMAECCILCNALVFLDEILRALADQPDVLFTVPSLQDLAYEAAVCDSDLELTHPAAQHVFSDSYDTHMLRNEVKEKIKLLKSLRDYVDDIHIKEPLLCYNPQCTYRNRNE